MSDTEQPRCAECGRELALDEIEDGCTLCTACWHWLVEGAERDADD